MKSHNFNIQVTAKQCRGDVNKMIRQFIKKVKKHGIKEEILNRRYYKKPSVMKKEKRIKAARARMREQRKAERAEAKKQVKYDRK
tara:strand:+ start:51341 stop:51595 length:255 start_codon:yes stop_codon:yes gene_type:complete